MLRFRGESSDNLIEFALTAVLSTSLVIPELLFAPPNQCFDSFADDIANALMPLFQNQFTKWGDRVYVSVLHNTRVSSLPPILYIYIKYTKADVDYIAFCVVSKYIHFDLIARAVDEMCAAPESAREEIYERYHRLQFRATAYDVVAQRSSGEIVAEGLSGPCEIARMCRRFLSHYPPYFIGLLAYALLRDQKVVVMSGDFARLSSVAFCVAALMRPLDFSEGKNFFPVLTKEKIGLLKQSGPAVLGLHLSMIDKLFEVKENTILFNADEPFICCLDKSNEEFAEQNFDSMYTTICDFHTKITKLCKAYRIAYPAPLIAAEIKLLIRDTMLFIFKKKSLEEIAQLGAAAIAKKSKLLGIAMKNAKDADIFDLLKCKEEPMVVPTPDDEQLGKAGSSSKKKK